MKDLFISSDQEKEEHRKIVVMYLQGETLNSLARICQTHTKFIRKIITDSGVVIKSNSSRKQYATHEQVETMREILDKGRRTINYCAKKMGIQYHVVKRWAKENDLDFALAVKLSDTEILEGLKKYGSVGELAKHEPVGRGRCVRVGQLRGVVNSRGVYIGEGCLKPSPAQQREERKIKFAKKLTKPRPMNLESIQRRVDSSLRGVWQ